MSCGGLTHSGFLGFGEWAELDPGQAPGVRAADPDVADPCADLNVVAVGGGLVALHSSDDGGVGEVPNVDLADVQLVVGEEFVPVNPLLLVEQEPLRADGQELRVDELAESVPVIVELRRGRIAPGPRGCWCRSMSSAPPWFEVDKVSSGTG